MKVRELFETEERSILSTKGKQEDPFPSDFCCYNNKLTSLVGAPSVIKGNFFFHNNKLTSLKGINKLIKEISGGYADFDKNPITSHVLGLLRIKGLRGVWLDNKQVQKILNKYLEGDRDIFACQSELLDAGYEDFAQL